MNPGLTTVHHHLSFAEVEGGSFCGFIGLWNMAVRDLLPQNAHLPAYRPLRTSEPMFVPESIIDSLSRMTLFHRTAPVLFQPLFDDGNMGTQHRLGHRLLPSIGRNPSVHYCLPNSPSTVFQLPSNLPDRLALDRVLPPNNLFLFHRNHPLRPPDQQCLPALPIPKGPLRWSLFTWPLRP